MCGIYFAQEVDPLIVQSIQARGPDAIETVSCNNDGYRLTVSVLQMRTTLTPQPVVQPHVCLAWNGELYNDPLYQSTFSDTAWVGRQLTNLLDDEADDDYHTEPSLSSARLSQFASQLEGEFAFVIVTNETVFFARDRFGRRSLLYTESPFRLTSVGNDALPWLELPVGRVWEYSFSNRTLRSEPPWTVPLYETISDASALENNNNNNDPSVTLERLLREAVRRRLHHNATAILFSGGLDSTVLASLALEFVQSLELLTVSFVDPQHAGLAPDAADAVLAQQSCRELQSLYPHCSITLIHKIVPWEDIQSNETHIRQLLYPKTSVMDLNIGTALWFAAQLSTSSRALLSGLGADELFGGYTRHKTAYRNGRFCDELQLDQNRLWERNLGRDDRVLSDTSREVRFPFLDDAVVAFAQSLSANNMVDYTQEQCGDKYILRKVAQRRNLSVAAVAVKRAIQFGSRIAHVSDTRRFGSRRKAAKQK